MPEVNGGPAFKEFQVEVPIVEVMQELQYQMLPHRRSSVETEFLQAGIKPVA